MTIKFNRRLYHIISPYQYKQLTIAVIVNKPKPLLAMEDLDHLCRLCYTSRPGLVNIFERMPNSNGAETSVACQILEFFQIKVRTKVIPYLLTRLLT